MSPRHLALAGVVSALLGLSLLAVNRGPKAQYAGPIEGGYLLPNSWKLTPARKHVELPDLPLNIVPLADSRRALVATSGFNTHRLALVDLKARQVVASQDAYQSWFGLAVSADEKRVWWSGGGA